MNLVWNVMNEDANAKAIIAFNVFAHHSFLKEVEGAIEEDISRSAFERKIHKAAQYYFWSKSEYEVVVTSWPPYIDTEKEFSRLIDEKARQEASGWNVKYLNVQPVVFEKIDIYAQLELNWDRFIDYLWRCKINWNTK